MAKYRPDFPLNKRDLTKVSALIGNGFVASHPEWSKASIIKHEQETVANAELLRRYVIEKLVKEREGAPSITPPG